MKKQYNSEPFQEFASTASSSATQEETILQPRSRLRLLFKNGKYIEVECALTVDGFLYLWAHRRFTVTTLCRENKVLSIKKRHIAYFEAEDI